MSPPIPSQWTIGIFFGVAVIVFAFIANPLCSFGAESLTVTTLHHSRNEHGLRCDKVPRISPLLPVPCITICPSVVKQTSYEWILNIPQYTAIIRDRSSSFWKYSERGSDGIMSYIFSNIGVTNKFFVEFGINNPSNLGSGSNTRYFWENCYWNGLLMDIDNDNPDINLHKEFITSSNIISLFEKYDVPTEPDLISIDIDSHDVWVFLALTKKFRPRVIQQEYNANFECDEAFTVPDGEPPNINLGLYGASLGAFYLAGKDRGYSIVYVDRGDVWLIRDDILPGLDIESLRPYWQSWGSRCGIPTHVQKDNLHSEYFFDYANISGHKIPEIPKELSKEMIAKQAVEEKQRARAVKMADTKVLEALQNAGG